MSVALVARDRAEDPSWFADQVLAPFTELIATDLGPSAAADRARRRARYVIEAQLDDPDDLGHVQAAWALAKCVCEEGAAVVIDVYAARAHLGSRGRRAARPSAASTSCTRSRCSSTSTATARSPRGRSGCASSAARTSSCSASRPTAATDAALLLRDVAATLAAGERIEPGDQRRASGWPALDRGAIRPATSPVVAVEGDALLLRLALVDRRRRYRGAPGRVAGTVRSCRAPRSA